MHYRKQIHKRYPAVWNLKLIKRASTLIKAWLRPGTRILDVGAGDRRLGEKVKDVCPGVVYKSMDMDRSLAHDYYSLDGIEERFDIIVLLEVVEHLEPEETVDMLKRLKELLNEEGRLIISTPNIFHPNRFWNTAAHKTFYSYEELGGLLLSQGFDVLEIYRVFNASFLKYLLRLTIFNPLHRILNVDFAKSIVAVARTRREE